MLRSVSLKNFRKHEDTEITFERGLNAIRGANEAGKSTIIESVLYALYGSKALRDTLAETVTWSKKESELKVTLVIEIGGVEYTFKRSRSGAEAYSTVRENGAAVGGTLITGQAEVTSFAADLLGADAKTANLLMLASQNGLRGALDDGPTAVSGLMSKLADFDLIDRIVEAAQGKLLLGAEAPIRVKLADAEIELTEAKASIPAADTVQNFTMLIANHQDQLDTIEKQRADVFQPAVMAAQSAYADALNRIERRLTLTDQITQHRETIADLDSDIVAARAEVAKRPAPEKIEALQRMVHDAANQQRLVDLHATFLKLPMYPAVYWDEPRDDFMAEFRRLESSVAELKSLQREKQQEINVLKGTLITNGKCPTCGSTSRSDEHVAAHNAPIEEKIKALKVVVDGLPATIVEETNTLDALRGIEKAAAARKAITDRLADYLEFDDTVYPPRVDWRGEVPRSANVREIQAELDALQSLDRAASRAEGQLSVKIARREEVEKTVAGLVEQRAAIEVVDVAPLAQTYDEALNVYTVAGERVEALQKQITELTWERDDAQRKIDMATLRLENAQAKIDEYNNDLKTLAFNNTLIGKLRKLKPSITDHLWNSVLSAVSNFFSQLRGEQSVVTKDSGGFKVNGRSIESLSGSTLDALAIATRVALTKTFIPHATFLVLDEPAHGADTARTGNILGFLASVGFQQVLLASHDELSEAVADHVISLGA